MVDKRITDLPPAGPPLEGDVYPVVQGVGTFKQTLTQLRAAIGAVIESFVGLGGGADKLPYYTGPNSLALTDLTLAGREILNDSSFTAMLNTLNSEPSVSLASAATVNLGAAASRFVTITGVGTITSFGTAAAGVTKEVTFGGALTLTYNATSMKLPGGESIVTAAGDMLSAISLGSGNWQVSSYSSSEVERGSDVNGEWFKFRNGLLLQKLVVPSQSVAVTNAYGSAFYGPGGSPLSWTFPLPFVGAVPDVRLGCYASGRLASAVQASTPTLTGATFVLMNGVSGTDNYALTYIAIGRWKV